MQRLQKAQRPYTLENVCLADYAAYYYSRTGAEETSRSDDEFEADSSAHSQNTHTTTRRSFGRVIRTFHPSDDEPEKKARQKLMLYHPWIHEQTDLYAQYNTYSEHFETIKQHLADKIKEFI